MTNATAPRVAETMRDIEPPVLAVAGKPNLYQKLASISAGLGAIQKDGTYDGGQRGGSYKFISHAALMGHLRNELARHNVVIIPEVIEATTEGREKHSTYNGQERVSFERRVTVRMLFTVVDGDDPESKFTAQWSGEGIDAGDKGTQKAGTSAEKYFLFKLFKVSDKDDPDAENPDTPIPTPSHKTATPPVAPGPDRDPVAGGSGSPTWGEMRDVLTRLKGDGLLDRFLAEQKLEKVNGAMWTLLTPGNQLRLLEAANALILPF